ncbi:MAG: hypothetical protein ACLR31_02665 [Escherichia coli]
MTAIFRTLPNIARRCSVDGGAVYDRSFPNQGCLRYLPPRWRCIRSKTERALIKGLTSGALTIFVTGITEPLEYAFLFAAPGSLHHSHLLICHFICADEHPERATLVILAGGLY